MSEIEDVENLLDSELTTESLEGFSANENELNQNGDESTDPEIEAIRARVKEMEAEQAKLKQMQEDVERQMMMPGGGGGAGGRDGSSLTLGGAAAGAMGGKSFPSQEEKEEADQRSVYVGSVDYTATADELEQHFNGCGAINRVTILCDKYSGHPKGFAYIEFSDKDSVTTAEALNDSLFKGRAIKVMAKRFNVPGVSTTNSRGFGRGRGRGFGGYGRGRASFFGGGGAYRPYRGRGGFRGRRAWYTPY